MEETCGNLKQPHMKRNGRCRQAKGRSLRLSDVESDTGSDGLAVNSEGSGRSGDWSIPKIRLKSKSYRKRQENRTSLTDSGISLSKTDIDSLSELSASSKFTQGNSLREYQRTLLHPFTEELSRNGGMKIPSSYKPLDRQPIIGSDLYPTPTIFGGYDSINSEQMNGDAMKEANPAEKKIINIEQKEKDILEQCFKNEDPKCGENSYVIDCSLSPQSRFPLPDHLNYPINRYRSKLETHRVQPLKRLKAGWKKFKAKKLFNGKKDSLSPDNNYPEINYPEFYPGFTNGIDGNNEEILSRLSRNPNERRSFARRVLNRFGTKTYSMHIPEDNEHRNRIHSKGLTRSASTRSVPEALQDMWNKVHDSDSGGYLAPPNEKTIKKVASMPTIHGRFDSKSEVTHLHENDNYFSQFINSADDSRQAGNKNSKSGSLACGTDITTSLNNLQLSKQDTGCSNKQVGNGSAYNAVCKIQHGECEKKNKRIEKENLTASSKKYSSCHELYQKSDVIIPQVYVPQGHCICCTQGQYIPYMQVPLYHYPNFMYHPPPYEIFPPINLHPSASTYYPANNMRYFYPYGQHYEHLKGVSKKVDDVVAPLPVKVAHERKAEKRRISEMVFDTFV